MKRTSHSLWSTLSIAALLAGGMAAGPVAAPAFAASERVALPLDPKTYRYSSTHGPRCIPVMNGTTAHQGQDLAASDGNNIYAVADGVVTQTRKGTRGGVSGYVVVRHFLGGNTYYTAYIHMWDGNEFARVGQSVRAGQKIGEVGNSGPSTAAHLHFEVWGAAGWMRGSSLDPMKWLLDRGVDVKKNASVVYNFTLPTSCSYWAATDLNLRATASASAKNLKLVKKGAKMTSVPGAQLNGYIRVTTGGTTGWAIHGAVAPFVVHPVPEKIDVQPLSTIYYVATANVNLREGPSTAYRSLGTVSRDTKVKVTGKAGSWLRVVHGSKTGFVSASYLKISAPAAPKPPVIAKPKVVDVKDRTMQVVANHNMRVSATSTAKAVATVKQGAKVTVTHTYGSWSKVAYAGRVGWMASYALKTPVAPKPPVVTKPKVVDVKDKTMQVVGNQSMRSSAYSTARAVATVKQGAKVTVTHTYGSWSKVAYAGRSGWMPSYALKTPVAPKPPVVTKPKVVDVRDKTMQVVGNQSMRSSAYSTARAVATVKQGAKVTVTHTYASWSKVAYAGRSGWMPSYALKTPVAPKPPVVTKPKVVDVRDKTMQVVGNHGIRVSAYSTARAVATVKQGAKVTVTHTYASWSKVAYAGRSGWMPSYALKSPTATPATTTTMTTTANLHLRAGAGTQYRSLALIGSGSAVRVTSTSNGWSKVTYAGKTGWASSEYLK